MTEGGHEQATGTLVNDGSCTDLVSQRAANGAVVDWRDSCFAQSALDIRSESIAFPGVDSVDQLPMH